MNRRKLFQSGAAFAGAAALPAASTVPLREKFFGCIAGVPVGSSMGALVENWSWRRIRKEHGTLTRLLPYEHYRKGRRREPATTGDGVEQQKLRITAIIEKQDRIDAEDLRAVWVRGIRAPAMAKTQIAAASTGKYTDSSGLVSMFRSCHPIGLLNAGDPEAPVDSVIGAVFDHCDRGDGRLVRSMGVRGELERAIRLADSSQDFKELRRKFDDIYSGRGIPYSNSYANEVVSKGIAIFRLARGSLYDARIAAVNFGRGADCLAAVAAGISGALSGGESMPAELVEQVDRATKLNPHTNSQRTIRETSAGMYNAYRARLERLRRFVADMERA